MRYCRAPTQNLPNKASLRPGRCHSTLSLAETASILLRLLERKGSQARQTANLIEPYSSKCAYIELDAEAIVQEAERQCDWLASRAVLLVVRQFGRPYRTNQALLDLERRLSAYCQNLL